MAAVGAVEEPKGPQPVARSTRRRSPAGGGSPDRDHPILPGEGGRQWYDAHARPGVRERRGSQNRVAEDGFELLQHRGVARHGRLYGKESPG